MLDDLRYIHEHDGQDALGIAEKQYQQLSVEFDFRVEPKNIANVIITGMGGSALAGIVAQTWLNLGIPLDIIRNYSLPKYVSEQSLVIVSSYSGNTEETLSALSEAENRSATIVIVASGGKLAEIARQKNYPLLSIPVGYQPRHATIFNLKALATVFDGYGLSENAVSSLMAEADFMKLTTSKLRPDVATKDNRAKTIALDLVGKSIVVYSGPLMSPAAYKWKINFNENAKHIAWYNQLPEFNHNEFLGWTKQPVDKPYAVVDLRSQLEHPRVQKRFELTQRLLSGMRPDPIVIQAEGEALLSQLLWLIILGDFTSIYLALLNGLNPTPVEMIEKFKNALDDKE
jgi:glucose/mannose-6-phosphate isomerase